MIPIVTPEEMAAIDAAAPEPVEELIERAGAALARAALDMLGGGYGRRVTVLAGKGNNGADGRAAAQWLRRRGVRVAVIDAADPPAALPPAHLAIDAAYGTGLRRPYVRPHRHHCSTIPTRLLQSWPPTSPRESTGSPARFAANPGPPIKPSPSARSNPALSSIPVPSTVARSPWPPSGSTPLPPAPTWSPPTTSAVGFPVRPAEAHKWQTACWIIAGSPGMTGAAHLAATAAMRSGSGYVRLSTPGLDAGAVLPDPTAPTEAVGHPLPADNWTDAIGADDQARFRAMAIGPGLGRQPGTVKSVRELAGTTPLPLVIDGDGLFALGLDAADVLANRTAPTVLTPHDGEYRLLTDQAPDPDRFAAARSLAAATGVHILLKGPTTVVAEPGGAALAITNGDARLATAGTGDVLAGLVCGLLSAGVEPLRAAASAAWLHGQAANLRPSGGMAASDLLLALPQAWETATQQKAAP